MFLRLFFFQKGESEIRDCPYLSIHCHVGIPRKSYNNGLLISMLNSCSMYMRNLICLFFATSELLLLIRFFGNSGRRDGYILSNCSCNSTNWRNRRLTSHPGFGMSENFKSKTYFTCAPVKTYLIFSRLTFVVPNKPMPGLGGDPA